MVIPGGGEVDPPAPLQYVNGEWGFIGVDGAEMIRQPGETIQVALKQALKMELINVGATSRSLNSWSIFAGMA